MGETGRVKPVICPTTEAKYFCADGWTGICPTGADLPVGYWISARWIGRIRSAIPPYGLCQSSSPSPPTRTNSRALCVTILKPRRKAQAAGHRLLLAYPGYSGLHVIAPPHGHLRARTARRRSYSKASAWLPVRAAQGW